MELSGVEQPDSVPDTIYLQIRHLSESFFRKGDGNITEFRQPPGNNRTISFRRFSIVDVARCRQEEQSGTSKLTLHNGCQAIELLHFILLHVIPGIWLNLSLE